MMRRKTVLNALVYLLLIAFAATVPVWSYSVAWGDHPSELIGVALIAVLVRILCLPIDESRTGKDKEGTAA